MLEDDDTDDEEYFEYFMLDVINQVGKTTKILPRQRRR